MTQLPFFSKDYFAICSQSCELCHSKNDAVSELSKQTNKQTKKNRKKNTKNRKKQKPSPFYNARVPFI